MRELLRDPDLMTGIIRRRVLRAMVPAIRKLDRVARGMNRFADDHERVACIALARLAPVVLAAARDADDEERNWFSDPIWQTPEKQALLKELMRPKTREEVAEAWAETFRGRGPDSLKYETEEEAREYGRQLHDSIEPLDINRRTMRGRAR